MSIEVGRFIKGRNYYLYMRWDWQWLFIPYRVNKYPSKKLMHPKTQYNLEFGFISVWYMVDNI